MDSVDEEYTFFQVWICNLGLFCCRCCHLRMLTLLATHTRTMKSWMMIIYLEWVCTSLILCIYLLPLFYWTYSSPFH